MLNHNAAADEARAREVGMAAANRKPVPGEDLSMLGGFRYRSAHASATLFSVPLMTGTKEV